MRDGKWSMGIAGTRGVVSYDGDDITLVCTATPEYAALIVADHEAVEQLRADLAKCKVDFEGVRAERDRMRETLQRLLESLTRVNTSHFRPGSIHERRLLDDAKMWLRAALSASAPTGVPTPAKDGDQ